jgi:general secretion pathway protein N
MMKLPLVLFLLGPALAASAGTFDDRDAQALEPGQYGTSAPDTAHSAGGATAPNRDTAAPAGNPSLANSAAGAAAPNRDAAALAGNSSWENSAGGAAAPNRDAAAQAGNPSWADSAGGAAAPNRDAEARADDPSLANSAGGATAPNRNAEAPAGNPLWAIPLNALTATRDRPLFSASRRPPSLAVGTVASPPSRPAPAAPVPPERPPLTLMGTIIGTESSIALVSNSSTQAVSRLRVGEEDSGWRVRGVDPRSIVVEKGVRSVTLDLPKPGEAPEQPPLNGSSPEVRRH